MRLTKTPGEYLELRDTRRELAYEAMLASGRTTWRVGERVRVYRTQAGPGAVAGAIDDEGMLDARPDRRDYDVDHYVRVLRDTFAARLARAFTPDDFAIVFADPAQPSLFGSSVADVRPILTTPSPEPMLPEPHEPRAVSPGPLEP